MSSSLSYKVRYVFSKALSIPRLSISSIRRGCLPGDKVFLRHMFWFSGGLRRLQLADIFPGSEHLDICLPRAVDRKADTSVTMEEACCICTIEKHLSARKVLEIGTYDGNTTLALAANLSIGGEVVTLDLPPEFDIVQQGQALAYRDGPINLTARDQLGRQFRGHPLSSHIKQIYGDSGALDWTSLGGPFDLIFIDGCHTAAYVRSDSRNALAQLRDGGVIVWHDYGMLSEVSKVVDQIAREVTGFHACAIEGTRLAVGWK